MRRLLFALVLLSPSAFAFDPANSSYRLTDSKPATDEERALRQLADLQNGNAVVAMIELDATSDALQQLEKTKDKLQSLREDDCQAKPSASGNWSTFRFCKSDKLFGGVAVTKSGDVNSLTMNAINYSIWLGGDYRIPFQLLLTAAESSNDADSAAESSKEENEAALLNAEDGYAIRVPILRIYHPKTGFCAFGEETVGHCVAGGDVTVSVKNLTDTTGKSKHALSGIARAGASLLFPIYLVEDGSKQGFVAIDAKLAYAYSNVSSATQLFVPVTDASGKTVQFKNDIFYFEAGAKFAIDGRLSIAARWIKPFTGKEYLTDRTSITIESQF